MTGMADPAAVDETAAWSEDGAGGAATADVPEITPTAAAPVHAWELAEDADVDADRWPWGDVWRHAAVMVLGGVLLAAFALAVSVLARDKRSDNLVKPFPSIVTSAAPAPSTVTSTVVTTSVLAAPAPPSVPSAAPAPSSAPVPAHQLTGDSWYLQMVNAGLDPLGMSVSNPSGIVSDGHRICGYIAQGHTVGEAVDEATLGMQPADKAPAIAQVVVGAAVRAYCPQYGG